MQCLQKFVLSLLKPGDGEAVNACAAFILSDPLPGFGEIGRIVDLAISEWTFLRLEQSFPPASDGASLVSSMPAQGLSQSELVRTSVMYSPGLRHLTPPHSTGPSPSSWSFGSNQRRRSMVAIRDLLF